MCQTHFSSEVTAARKPKAMMAMGSPNTADASNNVLYPRLRTTLVRSRGDPAALSGEPPAGCVPLASVMARSLPRIRTAGSPVAGLS